MPFLTRYGMDEAERRRRKAFLGINEADAENVRALRDAFAEHARGFAERFYEHLLADPHTRAYLRDPEALKKLKGLQAEYFSQLLEGVFDVPYFESRLRVGVFARLPTSTRPESFVATTPPRPGSFRRSDRTRDRRSRR